MRRSASNGSGRFTVDSPGTTQGAALSGGAAPLASMSALIAVQAAEEWPGGRARGQQRGRSLLDRLDEIRLGLLTDGIPRHTLKALAAELRHTLAECSDPKLAEILGEIELRALVELAKYDDGATA